MTKIICALVFIFSFFLSSYFMSEKNNQDDIDGKQANYCEMRSIYENSGGEYGWPRMDGYGECK